jgi:hypothetical protein
VVPSGCGRRVGGPGSVGEVPDGVERVTGLPPQSIEAFVAARRDFYLG